MPYGTQNIKLGYNKVTKLHNTKQSAKQLQSHCHKKRQDVAVHDIMKDVAVLRKGFFICVTRNRNGSSYQISLPMHFQRDSGVETTQVADFDPASGQSGSFFFFMQFFWKFGIKISDIMLYRCFKVGSVIMASLIFIITYLKIT